MDNLFKVLGRFFTRDVFYIFSGLCIQMALAYNWTVKWPDISVPAGSVGNAIFSLGMAYILGFTAKEIFGFARITVESHYWEPGWGALWLYRRHQRPARRWKQPVHFNYWNASESLATMEESVRSRYDRINNLVHVCSTVGTALIISGIVCCIKLYCKLVSDKPSQEAAEAGKDIIIVYVVYIAITILGIMLIAMSRFQAVRRLDFLSYVIKREQRDNG